MRRSVLTAITLISIYGAYRVYAAVLGPIVRAADAPAIALHSAAPSESIRSSLQEEIAAKHLPREAWARQASYFWQRSEEERAEDAYLFFENWEREEDELQNKLSVSPFAVVWYDRERGDEVPYVITAAAARVEFESRIELSEEDPGRIIRADLKGQVEITGPDNLHAVGREFTFDEAEGRLYSAHPIRFAYDPAGGGERVAGRADQFDVLFDRTDEPVHGDEMPLIGGLARVLLRRQVHIDLRLQTEEELTQVTIESDGQFDYDVVNQVATLRDNVRISRPTGGAGEPPGLDSLECRWLELAFAEKESQDAEDRPPAGSRPARNGLALPLLADGRGSGEGSSTDDSGLNLNLTLRRLRATGERVRLRSDAEQLTGEMHDLRYDAETRTIELLDDQQVTLRRGSDRIACPYIELVHDEADQVRQARCEGPGRVQHLEPLTERVEFELGWQRKMQFRPDPDTGLDVLVLEGEATVLQPQQRIGTAADFLKVWIDRAAAEQQMDSSEQTGQTEQNGALFSSRVLSSGETLPVKRVLAERDVVVVTPQMQVKTEHLAADVHTVPAGTTIRGRTPEETAPPGAGGRPQPPHEQDQENHPLASRTDEVAAEPPLIEAESIEAHLLHDPLTQQVTVAEVRASQKVTVARAGEATRASEPDGPQALEGPFNVQADELVLTESPDGQQVLTLTGSPCRIRHSEGQIEGHSILFDRQGNHAEVQGRGSLTISVSQDLEGAPLDEPKLLTVQWTDKMTFDGERIDFLGDVITRLETSLIKCEEMELLLTRRLSFAEDRPHAADVEIREVHCHDRVEAVDFDWGDDSIVTGKRKAYVTDFSANLQTGEFQARGPGQIEDWRRGNSLRVSLAPEAVASANQPVESQAFNWEYVRLKFAGSMTGNHRERRATLHDRVEAIYGPVNDGIETISRDELFKLAGETEQSKRSIWLGSDQLQILLQPAADPDSPGTLQVVAWGHAELEGQRFRARSHSVSYDEAKELFVLRGRGNEASIWHWNRPEAVPARNTARLIEIVPSRMELRMDGVTGIWGVLNQ